MVNMPNLPQGRVDGILINGKMNEQIYLSLKSRNMNIIKVNDCNQLIDPFNSHADMLFHHLGGNLIVIGYCEFDAENEFKNIPITIIKSQYQVRSPYPFDVALDAARIGSNIICNPAFTDNTILEHAQRKGIKIIPVKQGYAKCSVCVVDERSIITSDSGIAIAAKQNGLDVLKIREGHIILKKHNYGFIGGCSGKIAPDVMAFTGDLKTHPDYNEIMNFLNKRGVDVLSLCNGPLTDIGGIIPLTIWE